MKRLFTVGFTVAALRLLVGWLPAAEPDLATQIATETERLRTVLASQFTGHPDGELEKATQVRARGTVARRIFTAGIKEGNTNKLNEAVKLDALVGQPGFFDYPSVEGQPPLSVAVEHGHLPVIRWLLDRGAPVFHSTGLVDGEPDYGGSRRYLVREQPLHVASRRLRLDAIRLLVQAGAAKGSAGYRDRSYGGSPLNVLLSEFRRYQPSGSQKDTEIRMEAIGLLLRHGADPFDGLLASNPSNPFSRALWSGNGDLLDTLLMTPRPAGRTDADGTTLLHIAAGYGRTNAVHALLTNGVSPHAVNRRGITPLQAASTDGILRQTIHQQSGLFAVVAERQDWIANRLVAAGARWDPFSAIFLGRTNELAEALNTQPELVHNRHTLHESVQRQGTPLHYAALYGRTDAVRILLRHRLPLDATDTDGYTALHRAVAHGHLSVVNMLLEAGASVAVADGSGNTPLHASASSWGRSTMAALLTRKPNLDATNRLGQTALDLASAGGLTNLVSLLIQAGAKLSGTTDGKAGVLHVAAEAGDLGTLQLGLERKLPVDARDEHGRTAFRRAIEKGRLDAARLLLSAGADLNTRDTNGSTALHWRVRHGNDPVPELTPQPGFSRAAAPARESALVAALPPSVRPPNPSASLTPLLFLLESGADTGATNFAGQTPLHDLPQTGNNLGDRVGEYTRQIGRTVTLLLGYGAKLNAGDTNGATPLHLAAQRRNLLHLHGLLSAGAGLELRDRHGQTPLLSTAKLNFPEVTDYLLAVGADVQARDNDGNTLLHLLCANLPGTQPLPTNLVSHARFPELARLTNRFGSPPLHLALLNPVAASPPPFNKAPVVAMPWGLQTNIPPSPVVLLEGLLNANPPLDFTDTNLQTYSHLISRNVSDAAFKVMEPVLKRVVPQQKEWLNRGDRDGNTALHLAAMHNQLNLAGMLLTRGANPNLTNHAGQTPLLLSYQTVLGNKFLPGTTLDPLGELLMKHGARLDLADKDGRTLLQIAVGDFRSVPASLRPEGATRDPFEALDEGDAASLGAWLRADATLVRVRRHQHEGFPTLLQEAAQRQPKDFGPVFREAVSHPEPFYALAFGWADILRAVLRTNAGFAKQEIHSRPALHWAAGSGDVETVRLVLEAHADVHVTDAASQTALPVARARDARAIVELLIARGLRPTVFDCLASDDRAGLAELLQRDQTLATAKNRQGQPALLVAVAAGKLPLAELLLASGADANQGRVFNPPPAAPGAVIGRWIVGGLADRPLPAAVAAGNLPMTQLLLRHGADATHALPTRFTLLHQAVAAGNPALVATLLEHGADANAQHLPAAEAKPASPLVGDTPLHTAARTGRTNVMHLLLRHGAKLEATNALGQTPLGAVLYPTLDAPAAGEIPQAVSGFGVLRQGTFSFGPPKFPYARPTVDFLRQQGAKRADPPTKGSWREALEPLKVHHPAGPLPAVGTQL